MVYVVGVALISIFAAPAVVSYAGIMVGILAIAVGTGGIKPCVSSHGNASFELSILFKNIRW